MRLEAKKTIVEEGGHLFREKNLIKIERTIVEEGVMVMVGVSDNITDKSLY